LATEIVIDAVLTMSRWTSSTGMGSCGGASGAPAEASPVVNLDAGASLSRSDGPDPAHAVTKPNVAIPVIATVNHLRYNLQDVLLM
jgi:hypothetical protein